jgi:hypothetical protein
MNLAIDFDDTLTADPILWKAFCDKAHELGHKVWLVTCRRQTEENVDIVYDYLEEHGIEIPVIFTNLDSKQAHVYEMGLKIDIWVDDMPRSILYGR